jgi:Tol biopolymer transport system component
LLEDGHPSFCPANNDMFVTDTYPGKDGMTSLILYDLKSDHMTIVDELKSIIKYDNSSERCDLHPRWSFDGKYLTIDTVDKGVRGIYLYDIGHLDGQ